MNKKIYVSAGCVPKESCEYLTAGKEYLARGLKFDVNGLPLAGEITDDTGSKIFLCFPRCPHLNGESWTVHYE